MWLAALVIVMTLIIICCMRKEGFATKREKARKIHDWFTNNESHSYAKFRRDLNRESNIVEFEDVKKLFEGKNFTVDAIESVV